MTLRICVIVGNPKPASRTLRVAAALADRLFRPGAAEVRVFDLAEQAEELFKWPSDRLSAIAAAVAEADLAIFASPTYKASYTGMMKAFLDRFPASGLEGVPAICLMTGGSQAHSMAPVVHLVPLLAELGAVPLASVYFCTADMGEMDPIVDGHARRIRQLLARTSKLAGNCPPDTSRTDPMTDTAIDPLAFRRAMGRYASGLTIISAMDGGKPAGFTCQSFHSLSLDPPLVCFNVARTSKSWPVIRSAPNFSINILSSAQLATSQAFGRSDVDRWAHANWAVGGHGAPHLSDAMLCLDCDLFAEHEGGDHVIVVARVNGITEPEAPAPRDPLLFYQGRYQGIAALATEG